MRLIQVRECDGKCCEESPRFPNADHSDCIYHDHSCQLRRDPSLIPDGDCPVLPALTAADALISTCVQWPQNSEAKLGETANCCFQWVENGL